MTVSRAWIAAGVAVAVLAGGAFYGTRRGGAAFSLAPDADVNILLVTLDTVRADALSSYGGRAATPNLDRLAEAGARFTFAHAHSVVTLPSHTTMLTGRLPYEHGIRDNAGFRVADGTPTLATRLKAAGFSTGAFVAGFPLTKRFGLTSGFETYDDQMPEMSGALSVSLPERPADVVVGRAVEWVGRQDRKFFGWVHLFDAHSPYQPPADLASAYSDGPYFGEVAFIDRSLASLFETLRRQPRATIVIVTADHGESLGEHGEETHGMFAYEATLRVPLIIARVEPGEPRRTRGVVIDTPVRLVDLAPTVLALAGQPLDGSLSGTPLLDVVNGADTQDRPAYFEAMTYNLVRGWAPLRGVITGRDKYIDLPIPEYYDLAADPGEARNLASASAERLPPLRTLLKTYDMAPPNRPGQESAEVASVLRSLGYVSGSAPARAQFTEDDDPKRLVSIDRDLHAATGAFQQGDRARGIALLEGVIARRKDTADAYISLAYAHWEAGEVRTAVEVLESGLRNGAPDRDIRVRLGVYMAESGIDPARAVALLEGLPVTDAEAQNGLGVALTHAGRLPAASEAFRRVLALDPTNGIALQNLASIALRQALSAASPSARTSGLKDAESLGRQALAADPDLPDAHTTLGVVLSATGRKEDALASWRRAVTLDPAQFNSLYNLWAVLADLGRHDEAVVYGRQFASTAPPALFAEDIARVRAYLQDRSRGPGQP
jgi:tetratricopeptide (TPR) repeat protein